MQKWEKVRGLSLSFTVYSVLFWSNSLKMVFFRCFHSVCQSTQSNPIQLIVFCRVHLFIYSLKQIKCIISHFFECISNIRWCWSAFHLYTLDFPLLSQSANLCYFFIAHVCLSFVCSFLPLFLFLSISFLLAVSSSYNAYSGWCFYIFCCCADE